MKSSHRPIVWFVGTFRYGVISDQGIAPGTPFEDLPEDFECPVCGLGKDAFEKEE